jgi:hypothetical protein
VIHTDKELLELAAKAAGWTGWRSKHGYWNVESPEGEKSTHCHHWSAYCSNTGEKLKEPTFADAIADTNWNPLTDAGDALRLLVKLEIAVNPYAGKVVTWSEANRMAGTLKWDNDDEAVEVVCRAIVRAAAAIGEGM